MVSPFDEKAVGLPNSNCTWADASSALSAWVAKQFLVSGLPGPALLAFVARHRHLEDLAVQFPGRGRLLQQTGQQRPADALLQPGDAHLHLFAGTVSSLLRRGRSFTVTNRSAAWDLAGVRHIPKPWRHLLQPAQRRRIIRPPQVRRAARRLRSVVSSEYNGNEHD